MTWFRAAWRRLCRGGRNPCRRRRRLWQASPETGDGGRGAKRAGGRTQAAGRKQQDRERRSRGRIEVVSEKIKKRLFIKTYGCQMNVYDSARMADVLAPFGYEAVDGPRGPDMEIPHKCHNAEKASENRFYDPGR